MKTNESCNTIYNLNHQERKLCRMFMLEVTAASHQVYVSYLIFIKIIFFKAFRHLPLQL